MARQKTVCCYFCDQLITKDENGLNRKLLMNDAKSGKFRCLNCMAEYLECSVDDLTEKIEDFKKQGCKLFL